MCKQKFPEVLDTDTTVEIIKEINRRNATGELMKTKILNEELRPRVVGKQY